MTPRPVRVALIGARGRLGSFAAGVLRAHAEFELVGEFSSQDAWPELLPDLGVDVAFEATRAGLGAAHGQALLAAGVRPVIATSGLSPAQGEALDHTARELGLGGLIVPNLSLGIVLLERACRDWAAHFPGIEILEEHHERKLDAPSGTALELARALTEARAGGPDQQREIPIESRREAGRYAHHEVRFAAPGEQLTVRHDMRGPEAFEPGLLAALRFARTALGVPRGLAHALSPTRTPEP